MSGQTSTVRRWQLGQRLRGLRERAGIEAKAAALEIEVSPATMSKIETGRPLVRPLYVKALTTLYGADSVEQAALAALAAEAGQPEWFAAQAKHIPDWFKLYLGYESAADELRSYSVELVDGLLQTPAYARAITTAGRPESGEEELRTKIGVRLQRQKRLTSGNPLTLHAILNEAVLHRIVGGPEVMRAQLNHLVELSRRPNITVRILPFSAGAHPAMAAAFSLLRFEACPGMNTVYLENGRGALYLDAAADLARYNWVFGELRGLALGPGKSRSLLVRVARQL